MNPYPRAVVLGIDSSLTSTGWAVLSYETGDLLDWGLIETPDQAELTERLRVIRFEVQQVTRDLVHGRGAIVNAGIEDGFVARSGDVTRKLAMAWGVTALCLSDELGVPPLTMRPAEVKRLATGAGNAGKLDVMSAAVRRWPTIPLQNDIADAAWVAEFTRDNIATHMENQHGN